MWSSLVNIIDRTWREKRQPRKRFALAVMTLYTSLEICHNLFLVYKADPTDITLTKWKQSIDALIKTITSIEPVLKIFQSNMWAVLSFYCWSEFFLATSRDVDDMAYRNYLLNEELRSQLVVLDLLTAHDSKAEYDPSEPQHAFYDPLDPSRQRLLRAYHNYLEEGRIDDRRTIDKYRGALESLDDSDFKHAIDGLREWIKREFKPEELL